MTEAAGGKFHFIMLGIGWNRLNKEVIDVKY
jgi:hypothetical protein